MTGFGLPRHHLAVTESTNEVARLLAISGAPSGTVVTAGYQTAGRGRLDRAWSAPAGKALLCSAILAPLEREHALLPLAVPLAVCEAVELLAPLECRVKWPNDVWVDRRKLAGVLIQAQPPDWAVIGVGLNVAIAEDEFPADLRQPAASIGHEVGIEKALGALCQRLNVWVRAPAERVVAGFAERDALAGRQISWVGVGGRVPEGSGVAQGIDERGNLTVVTGDGEQLSLGAGEVQLVDRG